MNSWLKNKWLWLVKLIVRRRPKGEISGAWDRFFNVVKVRAVVAHILGMAFINLYWFDTQDALSQNMKESCKMCDGTDHKCDIEYIVTDFVPLVQNARILLMVIGALLIPALFWKLDLSRLILYYWILHDVLEI